MKIDNKIKEPTLEPSILLFCTVSEEILRPNMNWLMKWRRKKTAIVKTKNIFGKFFDKKEGCGWQMLIQLISSGLGASLINISYAELLA